MFYVEAISSILLVLQTDSSAESNSEVSSENKKYVIGFISTVATAAVYGLMLSVTQLAFSKVVKSKSFKDIFDMIVHPSLVACLVAVMGQFGRGEFGGLKGEMEGYEMGKGSYMLTLNFTAINMASLCSGMFEFDSVLFFVL
ncbi:probable purine permease 6 [Neltuma alba]|uniref:probable purine permease 6 n=1 Tax=Neltuma alba TaxID=207710 RepID=UPI0010A33D17|nr:probable purine permease 6 [Prosopis alba]